MTEKIYVLGTVIMVSEKCWPTLIKKTNRQNCIIQLMPPENGFSVQELSTICVVWEKLDGEKDFINRLFEHQKPLCLDRDACRAYALRHKCDGFICDACPQWRKVKNLIPGEELLDDFLGNRKLLRAIFFPQEQEYQ